MLWDSRLETYKITERKNAIWVEVAQEVTMTAGTLLSLDQKYKILHYFIYHMMFVNGEGG